MKKGKLATDYVVIGIIVVIVIFIISITVINLTTVTFDELNAISDDVFYDPLAEQEAVNDATVRAMSNLVDNLEEYCIGERNDCSCYTGQLGTIEDGAIVVVENDGFENKRTIISANGAYLDESTSDIQIGLFVLENNIDDFELSCVFPEKFYITGETEDYVNYWKIHYEDTFTDRTITQNGDDHVFTLYSQTRSGFFNVRKYEDIFSDLLFPVYKISDNQVCILTDLIDLDVSDDSRFISVAELEGENLGTYNAEVSQTSLREVFDDSNLCHKESTRASQEELEEITLQDVVDFTGN